MARKECQIWERLKNTLLQLYETHSKTQIQPAVGQCYTDQEMGAWKDSGRPGLGVGPGVAQGVGPGVAQGVC